MHPPLLPSVTALWDGNSVCFLAMGSALSLRAVLLWGAAYYDPPFFNDCRRELPEESLPVAGGVLPVAEKATNSGGGATVNANSLFMPPAWLLVSMVRHQQP